MAVIGISLIVASVIWVIVRPPGWVPVWFARWTLAFRKPGAGISGSPDATTTTSTSRTSDSSTTVRDGGDEKKKDVPVITTTSEAKAMPPPPPPPTIQPPTIQPPTIEADKADSQTTPKASAANPTTPVPSLSLDPSPSSSSSMMPPPPRPPTLSPSSRAPPAFPALNSAQRARGPLPNRDPRASSSSLSPGGGLAPPPTHSSKPSKPSRKVILTPGHSPLDWARISGPTADLRGVPSASPYLRVTPSMLRRQTGRRGTDAWMGLNGKVYNISPYADYHPGGVPELLRGAGRDGTKLFGEIHPWVNYETMLSACLVGLMVEEPEGDKESEMDKMD